MGDKYPEMITQWYYYVCASSLCGVRKKGHRNCQHRYHPITDIPDDVFERIPSLQCILAALREVAPTPRVDSGDHHSASILPSTPTPARCRTRFGPPVSGSSSTPTLASPSRSSDDDVFMPRSESEGADIGNEVFGNSPVPAPPTTMAHYTNDGSIIPFSLNLHLDATDEGSIREGTVVSVSSTSTENGNDPDREGTVISISSSESSTENGNVHFSWQRSPAKDSKLGSGPAMVDEKTYFFFSSRSEVAAWTQKYESQEVGGRKSREIDLPIKLRSERGPTDLTFERVSSSTSVLRPQNSPI
ncbi:hypothetical protein B0H13DRAFT_1869715 [Mycena leptocephala]|nr:hypothetical protein B0H13DRAFT_1869715 [Mycena leptocephala]